MLTEKQRDMLARYANDMQAMLSRMTVKQLRTYANEHQLNGCLGGATTKRELCSEIVSQMRYRKGLEMEGDA